MTATITTTLHMGLGTTNYLMLQDMRTVTERFIIITIIIIIILISHNTD